MSQRHVLDIDGATAPQARRGRWSGVAAAAWSVSFAVPSLYWAAGGTLGAGTIGPAVEGPSLAREPTFVAILWVTAVAKLLGGLLGLMLAGQLLRAVPHRMTALAGWTVAALLLLYGAANAVQHVLMAAGVVAVPDGIGRHALRWHLLLWDPVWLAGGVLFALAALHHRRAAGGSAVPRW